MPQQRKNNQYGEISNHLYLNAFYDIFNRVYTNAIVQTISERHECGACIQMLERSSEENVILIADRGFESYNLMAHAINKGWKFVIRVKDVTSTGIASNLKLSSEGSFDTDMIITRKQVNFTIAIYICREYLRRKRGIRPPDGIRLIEKHTLPVRSGCRDPRKVKP